MKLFYKALHQLQYMSQLLGCQGPLAYSILIRK
jgi:hypothetical protein